jgi:hypothetical protein
MFGASTTFSSGIAAAGDTWRGGQTRYSDPDFDYTVVVSTPSDRPDLWAQYVNGALQSYEKFGVADALGLEKLSDGRSTTMFLAAIDTGGRVVGGVRIQGPYTRDDQTHADVEWASDEAGRAVLRRMVAERLPEGVIELKTGWVAFGAPEAKDVARVIGQGPAVAGSLLHARYTLCTGATHVTAAHLRSGGVLAENIPPVAYPDDRYSTRVFWWDRHNLQATADRREYARMANAVDAAVFGSGPFVVEQKKLAS